jgi:hypothetical protein
MGLEYPDRLDSTSGRVVLCALDEYCILLTAAAEILDMFQNPSECQSASRRAVAVHKLSATRSHGKVSSPITYSP